MLSMKDICILDGQLNVSQKVHPSCLFVVREMVIAMTL